MKCTTYNSKLPIVTNIDIEIKLRYTCMGCHHIDHVYMYGRSDDISMLNTYLKLRVQLNTCQTQIEG